MSDRFLELIDDSMKGPSSDALAVFQREFDMWRGLLTQAEMPNEKLESFVKVCVAEKESGMSMGARSYLRSLVENKLAKVCNQQEQIKTESRGDVQVVIDYCDGGQEVRELRNTVLQRGKRALAKALTNEVEDPFDFYISSIIFGTNGTSSGTPKFVDDARTGLFGTTLLTKNVISSREDAAPTTSIFTSVITFDEGNGSAINEMALRMKNGELYSMITFPDLNKTSSMQLTFNWRISFL